MLESPPKSPSLNSGALGGTLDLNHSAWDWLSGWAGKSKEVVTESSCDTLVKLHHVGRGKVKHAPEILMGRGRLEAQHGAWLGWHTPIIPGTPERRWEDHKLEARLRNLARPCHKIKIKRAEGVVPCSLAFPNPNKQTKNFKNRGRKFDLPLPHHHQKLKDLGTCSSVQSLAPEKGVGCKSLDMQDTLNTRGPTYQSQPMKDGNERSFEHSNAE